MPYHSKEARHGFSLAYSNCQNHYSRTLVLKYKHYVALTADVIAETEETEASLKKPLFHSLLVTCSGLTLKSGMKALWHMPVILALKRLRHADCKFQGSLGYIVSLCLKNKITHFKLANIVGSVLEDWEVCKWPGWVTPLTD